MKSSLLIALFLLSSCASNRVQEQIPPFQKENVCSNESLAFLKKSQGLPSSKKSRFTDEEIHSRLVTLGPSVQKCYEDEMGRTNKSHSFNLCFIVGYNAKGTMEFFEFSTKEIETTPEFKSCLISLKDTKELQGLKDVTIVQPFRLHPRR